jgi:hypothetical protein
VSPGPISLTQVPRTEAKSTEKHGGGGPYAGADYNLSLCPFQSRLQQIYHGHWALGNPMPETTLTLCLRRLQGIWIWPMSWDRVYTEAEEM